MDKKKETLVRYKIKIGWAKKQDPSGRVNAKKMLEEIGQDWEAPFCLYCLEYRWCSECPLFQPCPESDSTEGRCCAGLWDRMNGSYDWATWIKHAKEIVEFIKKNG